MTELCSITGLLGLTFSVAVAEFDELSEYVAVTLYLNIPAVLVLGCPFVQFQRIPPGKFLVSSFRTTKSDATGLLTSPRESPTVFVTSFPFIGYNCASDLVSNLVPVAAYTYAWSAVKAFPSLAVTAIVPAVWACASVTLSLKRTLIWNL